MSEQMFEMTSGAQTQSPFPLVNCFSYTTLLEASPRSHQPLLQVCHILWGRVVASFMHHSTNVVIKQIKVQAAGRPLVGSRIRESHYEATTPPFDMMISRYISAERCELHLQCLDGLQ